MKLFLLITLISVSILRAQVSLVIEDERSEGFFLGINGYLQNQDKKEQVLVTGLDTSKYLISIRTGAVEFNKTIQLREPGTHKYVLTNDFYGKLKLRYRGNQSKAPSGLSATSLSSEVKWPVIASSVLIAGTANPGKISTLPSQESTSQGDKNGSLDSLSEKSDTTISLTPKTDSAQVATIVTTAITDSAAAEPTDNTDAEKSDPENSTKTSPEALQTVLNTLDGQEFEFDKLSISQEYLEANMVTSNELGKLFEQLKYDQSRMQLIQSSITRVTDPENLANLARYFEYEISKSQFILFINE